MEYRSKYPVIIQEENDDIETGFTKVNLEFTQIFNDLQLMFGTGGHSHVYTDITNFPLGGITPIGGIIDYFGFLENLPINWKNCDGTNGTPDLRGAFTMGASATHPADNVLRGEATHILTTAELAEHTHEYLDLYYDHEHAMYEDDYEFPTNKYGPNTQDGSNKFGMQIKRTSEKTGSGTAHNNLPPYKALYKIMRVS